MNVPYPIGFGMAQAGAQQVVWPPLASLFVSQPLVPQNIWHPQTFAQPQAAGMQYTHTPPGVVHPPGVMPPYVTGNHPQANPMQGNQDDNKKLEKSKVCGAVM